MKYVILIHANPQPWGHPTAMHTAEGRALGPDYHDRAEADFVRLLTDLHESGELLSGEALGDPLTATTATWKSGSVTSTDGPYAETKEHLAGFFLIDVASRPRAEEIVAGFAGPGSSAELRPVMDGGGHDD